MRYMRTNTFCPVLIHPDKAKPSGVSKDRITMFQVATEVHEGWEVSDIEYNREETSYTVHTMERLTKLYDHPHLVFVCGADIMYTIHTWRDPDRLFQLCDFAVVQRPGYATEAFLRQVELVKAKYGGEIQLVECDQVDVSSSDIRTRLCNGLPVSGMMPDSVIEYIKEHGLYTKCTKEK